MPIRQIIDFELWVWKESCWPVD